MSIVIIVVVGVIPGDTAKGEYSQAVSDNPFDPSVWQPVDGFDLTDLTYHRHVVDGAPQPTVRVAFDRPEVRNAFRPHTVDELYRVIDHARMSPDVGVVLLTGNGPSPKDGGWAFCSGGDQRIRGRTGYQYASGQTADTVDVARRAAAHSRGAAVDPVHAESRHLLGERLSPLLLPPPLTPSSSLSLFPGPPAVGTACTGPAI